MGSPLPTILWYKDDRLLSAVGGNRSPAGSGEDDIREHHPATNDNVAEVGRMLGVTVSELHIQCISFQDVSFHLYICLENG